MWRPRSSLFKSPAQKQRGSPDQRGMGAQSDFISEVFVPSSRHRAQQLKMADTLIEIGMAPEEAAALLSVPQRAVVEPKKD